MIAKLRDYQIQAIDANNEHLYKRNLNGTIDHLSTGLGKTVIAAETIKQLIDLNYQRVLFIVHTTDLIFQTFNAFNRQFPELRNNGWTKFNRPGMGICMGKINNPTARVIIGTPQTLSDAETGFSNRIEEILKYGEIDLMIIDEAHYAAAKSYLNLASRLRSTNERTKRLGLTATPMRSDGMALRQPINPLHPEYGMMFDSIAISRNIKWGISNGYLCPIKPPLLVETNMPIPDGKGSLETRASALDVNNWSEIVVEAYQKHGEDRAGIYFLPSVQHSKDVSAKFNEQGIVAIHIDGDCVIMPDGTEIKDTSSARTDAYAMMTEGKAKILCNYNVLTHGFDMPHIALIGLARPTDSPVLVTQIIGRGTRLHHDKSDLLVLDYALKDIPLMLSGSLLGYTWDDEEKKMVEDEEAEIEEISDGLDLRDFNDRGMLVDGNGVVVRVGSLFKQYAHSWYYDDTAADSMSLSLSEEDALVVTIPNYTLSNKLQMRINNGAQFIMEHPENEKAKVYYELLVDSQELFGNYCLWHVHSVKDILTNRSEWVASNKWLASADNAELLFDYAAPVIAKLEDARLSLKTKNWRKQPVSEAQKLILNRLKVEVPDNKGEASQKISHTLVVSTIRKKVNSIKKAIGE